MHGLTDLCLSWALPVPIYSPGTPTSPESSLAMKNISDEGMHKDSSCIWISSNVIKQSQLRTLLVTLKLEHQWDSEFVFWNLFETLWKAARADPASSHAKI